MASSTKSSQIRSKGPPIQIHPKGSISYQPTAEDGTTRVLFRYCFIVRTQMSTDDTAKLRHRLKREYLGPNGSITESAPRVWAGVVTAINQRVRLHPSRPTRASKPTHDRYGEKLSNAFKAPWVASWTQAVETSRNFAFNGVQHPAEWEEFEWISDPNEIPEWPKCKGQRWLTSYGRFQEPSSTVRYGPLGRVTTARVSSFNADNEGFANTRTFVISDDDEITALRGCHSTRQSPSETRSSRNTAGQYSFVPAV